MAHIKSLTYEEINEMMNEDRHKEREKELIDFTKCILYDPHRFNAICEGGVIDGADLEDCCERVDKELLMTIKNDALFMLCSGKMKVNGKMNNWSNGCFGSRWFDMDAKKYGVDYIRGAFYSKKFDEGMECDKPYKIMITVEKAKRAKNVCVYKAK